MRNRNILFFAGILVIYAATAPSSHAGAQPISFFKEATDVNGFVAVAADSSGLYAVSTAGVRRYDSQSNLLWTQSFDTMGISIQATSDNAGVYVLVPPAPPPGPPGPPQGPPPPCVLVRFTAAGARSWSRNLTSCQSLAADGTSVYVNSLSPSGPQLVKYDSDNEELWTHTFGRNEVQGGGRIVADSTGVYLVTSTAASIALPNALFLHKLSPAGDELWTHTINVIEFPVSAAADGTGLYLLLYDIPSVGIILRKFDVLGNELWNHPVEPTFNPNNARLAVDETGAYVAGQIKVDYDGFPNSAHVPGQCQSGSGSDSYVRKYDSASGDEVWARQFGTSQAVWAKGVAAAGGAVFVVGEEGAAQVRDDFEHIDAFQPAMPTRAGFVARFESAAAPAATSGPRIFPNCVVNSASYLGGGVAPREMVTIFGAQMGPSDPVPLQLNPDGKLATALAGTRVLFNGVAAPLLYVSANQNSAIVPASVAGLSTVDVQVEYNNERSESLTLPVLDARPGIFSVGWFGSRPGCDNK